MTFGTVLLLSLFSLEHVTASANGNFEINDAGAAEFGSDIPIEHDVDISVRPENHRQVVDAAVSPKPNGDKLAQASGNVTWDCPPMAPLSEEEAAERLKNWKTAMANHQALMDANVSLDSSCISDIRGGMRGCHQLGSSWCWATGATGVGHFFHPEKYHGCIGVECQVVGHKKNPHDAKACCRDKQSCDKISGTMQNIVDGIQWLLQTSEKTYVLEHRPLSQEELDKAVYMGNPVLFEMSWYDPSGVRVGGHIIWSGGCSGSGSYYIHDPENSEGQWSTMSYSELLTHQPRNPHNHGKWTGTMYLDPQYSTCHHGFSKGCGPRKAAGPGATQGQTCTNCGCHPCDSSDHKCFACTGYDSSGGDKCFAYDCGRACSDHPCSPLVKGYPKAPYHEPAPAEVVV